MPSVNKMLRIAALVAASGVLVACDNAEDRAQAYYNKGVQLAENGEIDKAILEFRNALQLNQDAPLPRLDRTREMRFTNTSAKPCAPLAWAFRPAGSGPTCRSR